MSYDQAAANHSGQIRVELAKAGQPNDQYDQMIASHARSLGLILVINTLREFEQVSCLGFENRVNDQ